MTRTTSWSRSRPDIKGRARFPPCAPGRARRRNASPRNGRWIACNGSRARPGAGSRRKDIGGTGEWGVFALSDVGIPLKNGWPQLAVQTQFGYQQQIRLSNEQLESAETLGVDNIREKALIWRLALSLPVLEGRVVPTFEILGRTVLDAVASADEGTTLELGGGVWWNHSFTGSEWQGLSIGLAAKGPVTNRREADFSTLFVIKYEFE